MTYIPYDESLDGVAKVIYDSKDGKTTQTFDARDWLAQLTTHIPNRGESRRRRESDITDIIVINPVAYEKKPAPMTKYRR